MAKNDIGKKRSQAVSEAGVDQPAARLSAEDLKEIKKKTEDYIDAFMERVGYPNPAERTDEKGARHFSLGSAVGVAGVIIAGDQVLLRIEAPIMPLPSDKDLILPLFREMMELNQRIAGECRIGLMLETIVAVITYPAHALEKPDIHRCIHTVMKTADDLDDLLKQKYGGTSKKREE
jgi:hypothetical protein